MLITLLLSLTAPGAGVTPSPAVGQTDPPVRVWLNKRDGIDRGDELRVYARTELDGYLLVLHADPAGRIRVLFPLDPGHDNYVRGARDYEIRGRGDRNAFTVYESTGRGTVYAAYSRDPFAPTALMRGDHWDYTLPDWTVQTDAEADLTALVTQLTVGGQFDYDFYAYDVGYDDIAYSGSYAPSFYDPYFVGHAWGGYSGFSIHIGIGSLGYRRHYGYGGYHGYYDPYYYDPFVWGYPYWWYRPVVVYDPFGYWYTPYYWGGYYRSGPRHTFVANPRTYDGGRYTFKSDADRWGIRPGTVGSRPRYASASGRPSATTSTRRRAPATATANRGGTAAAPSRAPARRAAGGAAAAPSSDPERIVISGRRRPSDDGSETADGRRLLPTDRDPTQRVPLIGGRRPVETPPVTAGDDGRAAAAPVGAVDRSGRRASPTAESPAREPAGRPAIGGRGTVDRRVPVQPVPRSGEAPKRATTAPRGLRPVDGDVARRSPASAGPRRSQPQVAPRQSGSRTPTRSARPATRPARTPTRAATPRPAPTRSAKPSPSRPAARPAPSRPAPRPAARPTRSRNSPPPRRSSPPRRGHH